MASNGCDPEYYCAHCAAPFDDHDLLTRRPPRWMCPGGHRVVWTVAHISGDVRSADAQVEVWKRPDVPHAQGDEPMQIWTEFKTAILPWIIAAVFIGLTVS